MSFYKLHQKYKKNGSPYDPGITIMQKKLQMKTQYFVLYLAFNETFVCSCYCKIS